MEMLRAAFPNWKTRATIRKQQGRGDATAGRTPPRRDNLEIGGGT